MKVPSLLVRKLWPRLKFFKSTSNFKVKRLNNRWYHVKGIVTRNKHVHYESLSILERKLWQRLKFLAHLSRRLEWAIVIAHCPSSVRRKLFAFWNSSPEPHDGFWWNLIGMKYSWFLTSVVVFLPDPPKGRAKIGHWGFPSSTNFFFRTEGYSNKPNA